MREFILDTRRQRHQPGYARLRLGFRGLTDPEIEGVDVPPRHCYGSFQVNLGGNLLEVTEVVEPNGYEDLKDLLQNLLTKLEVVEDEE